MNTSWKSVLPDAVRGFCGAQVQELLRHGSARITMDVYAQAMTPAKRQAQGKVVAMLRDGEKKPS
jgi:hypothetical protein